MVGTGIDDGIQLEPRVDQQSQLRIELGTRCKLAMTGHGSLAIVSVYLRAKKQLLGSDLEIFLALGMPSSFSAISHAKPLNHRPILLRMGPPASGCPNPIFEITGWNGLVSIALKEIDALAFNSIPNDIDTIDEIDIVIGTLTNHESAINLRTTLRCAYEESTQNPPISAAINELDRWIRTWRIEVNPKKSAAIHFKYKLGVWTLSPSCKEDKVGHCLSGLLTTVAKDEMTSSGVRRSNALSKGTERIIYSDST
ncbi:hypothetical protein EVAR_65300_1 [Eumeta japonica]|uniref:Uncharacterized protein n=1 Tax=Eumeta variegata TaxID=151549 RepID=A0A4C2AC29_EUMVA|nr:hypothetical protein EVAR_65300_1 [Eumeta japonica]